MEVHRDLPLDALDHLREDAARAPAQLGGRGLHVGVNAVRDVQRVGVAGGVVRQRHGVLVDVLAEGRGDVQLLAGAVGLGALDLDAGDPAVLGAVGGHGDPHLAALLGLALGDALQGDEHVALGVGHRGDLGLVVDVQHGAVGQGHGLGDRLVGVGQASGLGGGGGGPHAVVAGLERAFAVGLGEGHLGALIVLDRGDHGGAVAGPPGLALVVADAQLGLGVPDAVGAERQLVALPERGVNAIGGPLAVRLQGVRRSLALQVDDAGPIAVAALLEVDAVLAVGGDVALLGGRDGVVERQGELHLVAAEGARVLSVP